MQFLYLPECLKRLKALSKKYPSIKQDFAALLEQLKQQPQTGTPLGRDCYKIRLAIKSKGRGKSGGARVITCVKVEKDKLYFLTVYDKSEQSTISDAELTIFIEYINRL